MFKEQKQKERQQQHGGPKGRPDAEAGAVGDAEARHEGTAGTSDTDRQGHDAGATACAGRHGDGQGSVAEPQQQTAELATVVADQPGHCGHVEER